jgi:hypothetical protein
MTSKGMAGTALRMLVDDGFAKESKDRFEKDMSERK